MDADINNQDSNLPDKYDQEKNDLNKVRDILVGGQVKDIEKKFFGLEKKLTQDCNQLIEETKQTVISLENNIKKEIEELKNQLSSKVTEGIKAFASRFDKETNQKNSSIEMLKTKFDNIDDIINKKISSLRQKEKQTINEIKDMILNQSKSFSNDLNQKFQEFSSSLINQNQAMIQQKADKKDIMSLFTDMAEKLAKSI